MLEFFPSIFLFALVLISEKTAHSSRYMPSARQSEAKIRLALIFNEEKRYYSENAKYAHPLTPIFAEDQKSETPRNFYIIGIPDACSPPGHADENITEFKFYGMFQERPNEVRDYFRSVKEEDCRAAPGGFRIFAAAKIMKSEDSLDVWTIDQDKKLTNIRWGAQENSRIYRFFQNIFNFIFIRK